VLSNILSDSRFSLSFSPWCNFNPKPSVPY